MSKKVAFSTGALYLLETTEGLAKLKKAGFEHAELMPQCFSDLSLETLKKIDDIGIHISSIHYPLVFFGILYNANPGMIKDSFEFSDRLAEFAKKAGTEYVVVHPEEEYTGLKQKLVAPGVRDNLLYLCSALDKAGVTVAMENYPSGVGQYPDTLEAYAASIKAPNMKVMVDTTEVIEGGGDPIRFIEELKEVPCHLHMSDFADGTKHLPPGLGDIDWKTLIALLKKRGYQGYYNLEPSYKFYMENLDDCLKRDYDFISSIV